ncbi:acyl carrier protein [Streptomyces sp. NPDC059037]|uniref:acyl carrier protein n=1 Tax=Streptomyces sp. NPDC059037 TaxID=3346710 RepID=UPI00367ACB54
MKSTDDAQVFSVIAELAHQVDERIDPAALRLDDTPLNAYGFTSLTAVRLLTLIEDRFLVAVSDADVLTSTSMRHLVDLVQRRSKTEGKSAS